MSSLRSDGDEDEDQIARSCASEMVKDADADIEPSVSLQQHPVIYWSNGRRKAKLTLDVTYALPSETIDADVGGIAESLMEPILRHLRQQYSGQCENLSKHTSMLRRKSMEAPSNDKHRRDRSGPDIETKSSTSRRRKLGSENVDAPSAVDQLAKFIAETIIKGGHVLRSDDGNVQGWLRDLQKLDPSSMTLDQLFRTHTRIADGASRLSRQSSFIRCLLMVIISKRTGRPTSSEKSRSNAEEQAKDARLRRYLASTGRLFVELINAVSLTHGQRAYNICVALFVSPASNFSFNMPDLRRLQGGYSKEIVGKVCEILECHPDKSWLQVDVQSAFDPAKAVTAVDLSYEDARLKLGLSASSLQSSEDDMSIDTYLYSDEMSSSSEHGHLELERMSNSSSEQSSRSSTTIDPVLLTTLPLSPDQEWTMVPEYESARSDILSSRSSPHPHFTTRALQCLPGADHVVLFEASREGVNGLDENASASL